VEIVYRQSGGIGDGAARGGEGAREERNEHRESDLTEGIETEK